jgi:hypothetical protein
MKKVLLGALLGLGFFFGSCSNNEAVEVKKYITDGDFTLETIGYETWGDTINDGITQNVLIANGNDDPDPVKKMVFVKNTQKLTFLEANDVNNDGTRFAISSDNGLIKFKSGTPTDTDYATSLIRVFDFTVTNQIIYQYDSRKDPEASYPGHEWFEISRTVINFNRLK